MTFVLRAGLVIGAIFYLSPLRHAAPGRPRAGHARRAAAERALRAGAAQAGRGRRGVPARDLGPRPPRAASRHDRRDPVTGRPPTRASGRSGRRTPATDRPAMIAPRLSPRSAASGHPGLHLHPRGGRPRPPHRHARRRPRLQPRHGEPGPARRRPRRRGARRHPGRQGRRRQDQSKDQIEAAAKKAGEAAFVANDPVLGKRRGPDHPGGRQPDRHHHRHLHRRRPDHGDPAHRLPGPADQRPLDRQRRAVALHRHLPAGRRLGLDGPGCHHGRHRQADRRLRLRPSRATTTSRSRARSTTASSGPKGTASGCG